MALAPSDHRLERRPFGLAGEHPDLKLHVVDRDRVIRAGGAGRAPRELELALRRARGDDDGTDAGYGALRARAQVQRRRRDVRLRGETAAALTNSPGARVEVQVDGAARRRPVRPRLDGGADGHLLATHPGQLVGVE